MAVLAYPFAWVARAIGFASFGGLTAVFDRARVVLIMELCRANPPPSSKRCQCEHGEVLGMISNLFFFGIVYS